MIGLRGLHLFSCAIRGVMPPPQNEDAHYGDKNRDEHCDAGCENQWSIGSTMSSMYFLIVRSMIMQK